MTSLHAHISKMVTDKLCINIPSNMTSHMGFRLVYLDLTFSYSEGQLSYSESNLSCSASQLNHRNGVPHKLCRLIVLIRLIAIIITSFMKLFYPCS